MKQDGFDVLLRSLNLPGATSQELLAELSKRGAQPAHVISLSTGPKAEDGAA